MSFKPVNLTQNLRDNLEAFARNHDITKLYKEYDWKIDTWQNGFPSILKLEKIIGGNAKRNILRKEDILSIANWGNFRNPRRIMCQEILKLPLFEDGYPKREIEKDPSCLIRDIQMKIQGFGPTYLSKVLRFALPSEFGAIDTRIVRVVGIGDPNSKQQSWLSLGVQNDGFGWYIPKYQPDWPKDYNTWIDILRFFAHFLNNTNMPCPHPEGFLRNELRKSNIWVCADIEMALFSYASKHIDSNV